MDSRQIECFLAVVEELHFGRAAKKLHLAEQPLGCQVRKLEEEVGFKLFERTTRSVKLTPAGASFAVDAQRILVQGRCAVDTARLISQGKAGMIRLGYESATVVSILPGFVKLFRTKYPEISLELVEHSKEGLKPLANGDTDACLITRYVRLPQGFEYVPIMKDRAVIALSREHSLANKASLDLSALADVPFLGYAGANGESANRFMSQLVEYAGADCPILHEAETCTAILALVSAGLGFTIVTESMSKLFSEDVRFVPLADPRVGVDYGLAFGEGDERPIAESLRAVARHLERSL